MQEKPTMGERFREMGPWLTIFSILSIVSVIGGIISTIMLLYLLATFRSSLYGYSYSSNALMQALGGLVQLEANILLVLVALMVVSVFISIYILRLLFQRNPLFRKVYVVSYIAGILLILLLLMGVGASLYGAAGVGYMLQGFFKEYGLYMVPAILWCVYLYKSQRVNAYLGQQAAPRAYASQIEAPQFCDNCGARTEEDADYCVICGRSLR